MARWLPPSLVVASIILIQVHRIQVIEACVIRCGPGETVCSCPWWPEPTPDPITGEIIKTSCDGGPYCSVGGSCHPVPEWCPSRNHKYHTT